MILPAGLRYPAIARAATLDAAGRSRTAVRTAGIAAAILIAAAAQWGPDWPAQRFRAWTSAHHGLIGWTDQWYAGHPLWGYSVLYPPLAGPAGAAGVGLLAVVALTALARRLAPPELSATRTVVFEAAVVLAALECLLIGQVPFLLGAAFGAAALVAVQSSTSSAWTALAAAGCGLSSPLVGVFLLVATPALAGRSRRRAVWLAPAGSGALLSGVLGGASGPDPFTAWQFGQLVLFCAALVAVRPRRGSALRRFALTYLAVGAASFAVPNPMGGNVLRLGLVLALPLAAAVLPNPRGLARSLVGGLLVVAAVVWSGQPVVSALEHGSTDPSRQASYYTGLLGFLARQNPREGRLEIPFTRGHWESLYVATVFPLARGWERQTDLQYNAVLYHPLTPAAYRRWLDQNSVALVALPTEVMDAGGAAERALLSRPVSYLRRVWGDRHWAVWRVRNVAPLVTGPARLIRLGPSSVQLYFARPGLAVLHLRWSEWLQAGPGGCLQPAPGGWVGVRADRRGAVSLSARASFDLVVPDQDCSTG